MTPIRRLLNIVQFDLTNLLRANFLSYYILADTPESLSISIQGNAIITFVITKDNYITFTITKL